jgi:uncharacterized protein with PIN domain
MEKIKIYADEDVTVSVCKALRLRGFEAYATLEKSRCESTDEEQLEHATSLGAILLTHNVQDFPRIHYEFMNKGKHHNGIIVAKQIYVGEIVKSLLHLASALSSEDMKDRLE